ncbi:MAG: hydroxyisourate hydrolase [Alphaproteobacteria bacterium]|nr:hydroxyisourate hydrolase [Alphaproteobacteria bacterium]
MAGRLTTHVLDTARGIPAAGMALALYALDGDARVQLATGRTNANGRTDAPLLQGAALRVGRYELVFQIGEYFRAAGVALANPAFLDEVPLRFAIADAAAHYHVPLLCSPWSYSTYRGS